MSRLSSAAQQELLVPESTEWKQEASARLQAHRSRRAGHRNTEATPLVEEHTPVAARKSRIAQSVLERYAQAPSYAKYLEQIPRETPASSFVEQSAPEEVRDRQQVEAVAQPLSFVIEENPAPMIAPEPVAAPRETVSVSIELPKELPVADAYQEYARNIRILEAEPPADLLEESLVEPETAIPANLIEFPRVLVAARKARPRIAEGPLREESASAADATSQLRIFEVEPETISTEPLAAQAVAAPVWHDIRLDVPRPKPAVQREAQPAYSREAILLSVAPLRRRAMAAIVDTSLITLAYCGLVALFAACSPTVPSGKPGLTLAAIAYAISFCTYHWLFAAYGGATPGMRYARIALCAFRDDNPTRTEVKWRFAAFVLSLGTLGLGLLWSLVDDDRLGWHDRISGTYQRAY